MQGTCAIQIKCILNILDFIQSPKLQELQAEALFEPRNDLHKQVVKNSLWWHNQSFFAWLGSKSSLCVIYYRKLLAFTMGDLLKKEIDEFVVHWNSHRIRHSSTASSPGGIPNDLYDMPMEYGM